MLEIAISPCPNDTFVFHAWAAGIVGQDVPISITFGDIQQLNAWALEGRFPLIKLSLNCYTQLEKMYELLPVGCALGFNSGPKIIAKEPFPLEELRTKILAIPGKETTAHLLQELFTPEPAHKYFCLYHEIADVIDRGVADCGLIIHESRFTYRDAGFVEIVDLGELWHDETALPLPLGGIAIRKDLSPEVKKAVEDNLRASLSYAWAHVEASEGFVLEHAQEKDPAVVAEHIATYVNAETTQLSEEGKRAIETLSGYRRSRRDRSHPLPL